MYYVNRGGATQGPFPLEAILAGIRDGSLAGALLCPEGSQQWQPAEAFPEIARALQPPPQQQQPQYGPPPTQPSAAQPPMYGPPGSQQAAYGPPQQQQPPPSQQGAYGAPPTIPQPQQQQAYGAPPGAAAVPQPFAPPPAAGAGKKSSLGLLLGLGAGGLLLVALIAAAAVYFLVIRKPGPHLAHYAPKSTSVYVEIPGVRQSLISGASIKPLDTSKINGQQTTDDAVAAFGNAFSISPDDAKKVFLSLDAAALALRDTNGATKGAFMISFSSGSAAEKLFTSPRFTEKGSFGNAGKRYELARRVMPKGPSGMPPFEATLSDLEVSGTHDWLVWFPKSALLVSGDEAMVTEIQLVLETGADSLEINDSYVKAKTTFESGSDMIGFFDTHDLDDTHDRAAERMLDSYLKNRDPITGGIKITSAGVMMDMHATLTGTSLPPDNLIAHAPKLSYPHRLPAETVGYVAFSAKTTMKGADARAAILKHFDDTDPVTAKDIRTNLADAESAIGFKLDDVIDMTGDEGAYAIIVDSSFKYDKADGVTDELNKVGMVYVLAVKDDAKAKMVLGKIKSKIDDPSLAEIIKVKPDGHDGFDVDPETPPSFPVPNLKVRYDGKQIIMVLAADALSDRTLAALQHGTSTLGQDPGHELAFGVLPQDANMVMWLDTGRLTSIILDAAPHSKKAAMDAGLPLDAIYLTGPNRLTSALAFRATVKNGKWAIDLDSLNLPATGLLGIGVGEMDLPSALPSGGLLGPGSAGGGGAPHHH